MFKTSNIAVHVKPNLEYQSDQNKYTKKCRDNYMKYIYLDWNIIQYMKHKRVKGSIDAPNFYRLIKNISSKYHFPYSRAHLLDLASSYKESHKKYTEEDLKYTLEITNNFSISIKDRENFEFFIDNKANIFNEFLGILKKIEDDKNIEIKVNISGYSSNQIDINKMRNDDLFKEYIGNNNNILDASVMKEFIDNLIVNIPDPAYYKKFRKQVSELKSKYVKTPNSAIDQTSQHFDKVKPFLDFLTEKDEDLINSTFKGALEAFLAIDGRNISHINKYQTIEAAYMLLEFNPNFHDRVTKSNKPANINNDVEHLFFASEARYYITEDKATYKKATLVAKFLFPTLKVLTMSELQRKFC